MPVTSRFVPTADEHAKIASGHADEVPRSRKERILFEISEVMRFRIDLRQRLSLLRGDLFVRQKLAQGDDLMFVVVLPGLQLWRYQVSNVLGQVSEYLIQKYGTFTHFSDLCLEVTSGESILLQYSLESMCTRV